MAHDKKKLAALSPICTIPAAAEALGISRQRLTVLIEAERLPTQGKVGPITMLAADDVRAFAKQRRKGGRPRLPQN